MKRGDGETSFESSNEDKALFPGGGPTKGELIDYYERIAEVMLPHLRQRPVVLQRCPDGIEGDCFYQKQAADYFPDWIDRVTVSKRSGGEQMLVVVDSAATLAYLANQATITLHPWLSHKQSLENPDRLVIDLDPPGDDFEPVRRAAGWCRELLEELELTPFVNTTGSSGVHLVVGLDGDAEFDRWREFARAAMDVLAARHPDALTTEVRKAKRGSRVYLDVGRNAYAQTAVAAYSVRARPGAPVATPLEWEELDDPRLDARRWTVGNIFRRLGQREDPWKRLSRHAASLTAASRRLARLRG